MTLKIFTDGGAKGNPGPAAIGIVFMIDGKTVATFREDIGIATNNEAEYQAVIRALSEIKNLLPKRKDITKIVFNSDSQLMVRQLNGLFKVKNARIRENILTIRIMEKEIGVPISYLEIPREKNSQADDLVNDRGK